MCASSIVIWIWILVEEHFIISLLEFYISNYMEIQNHRLLKLLNAKILKIELLLLNIIPNLKEHLKLFSKNHSPNFHIFWMYFFYHYRRTPIYLLNRITNCILFILIFLILVSHQIIPVLHIIFIYFSFPNRTP